MGNLAWINGKMSDLAEAKISIEDRAFLFGDGIYEVARVYNARIFLFKEHMDRLERSAAAISLKLPYPGEAIKAVIEEMIEKSGYSEAYIYLQVTRGSASRNPVFPSHPEPQLIIFIRDLPPLQSVEATETVAVITLPDDRWQNCYIKSVNLLPNLLARQKASEAGAVEAILYRPGEIVSEGSRSNVFAVIEGIVRTHPESNHILSGITRQALIQISRSLAIPLEEKAFTLGELRRATEVWITSTTMELSPVAKIDNQSVNENVPGPISLRLMAGIREMIREHCL